MSVFGAGDGDTTQIAVVDSDAPMCKQFHGAKSKFGELLDASGVPRSLSFGGENKICTVFVPNDVALRHLEKHLRRDQGDARVMHDDEARELVLAHLSTEALPLEKVLKLSKGGEVQLNTAQGTPILVTMHTPASGEEHFTIRDGCGKPSHILSYTEVTDGERKTHLYVVHRALMPTSAKLVELPPAQD